MTINYKGGETRYLELEANPYNDKDMEMFQYVLKNIERVEGYELMDCGEGFANCEVENRAEFNEIARDIRNWQKVYRDSKKYGWI